MRALKEADLLKIAHKIKDDDKFAKAILKDFEGTLKKEGFSITDRIKRRVNAMPVAEKREIVKALKMIGKKRFIMSSTKPRSKEK